MRPEYSLGDNDACHYCGTRTTIRKKIRKRVEDSLICFASTKVATSKVRLEDV